MVAPAKLVLASEFYRLEQMSDAPILRLTRLPVPFASKEDVERACRPVQTALNEAGRSRVGLLIDTRSIFGRNDPTSEANFAAHRKEMARGFPCVAILVQTVVGKMHSQRLLGEDGAANVQVFMSDEEALAFLKANLPPQSR